VAAVAVWRSRWSIAPR